MTKLLLNLIGLAVIIILIAQDTWSLTLNTNNYEITVSFVLFIIGIFVLLWFYQQLKKPFSWGHKLKLWHQKRVQKRKNTFLVNLLNTLLNHDTNQTPALITETNKLYGPRSQEALLISALLKPDSDIFQQLNQTDKTRLAGLYGLIQQAQNLGDLEQLEQLLKQVPAKYSHTPWVRQTQQKLTLLRNDWSEALRLLERNKKYIPSSKYKSDKAILLLKLGQVKQAYKLDKTNPAVGLMYIQTYPKKAKKVLETIWKRTPGWAIYLAYKQILKQLPEEKRLKAILNLTRSTPDDRYSLLAKADINMELKNWARAKENLDIYLQAYPLTRQIADMMAVVERSGWNHEQQAQEWERKSVEAEDDALWLCTNCQHTTNEWHALCPNCNEFNTIVMK